MDTIGESRVDYESKTSTLLIMGGLFVCVAVLAWHIIFGLQPKIDSYVSTIDSIKVHLDTLRVREEVRMAEDIKRKKAWELWYQSFLRDEERKLKWDKDHPQYAPSQQ